MICSIFSVFTPVPNYTVWQHKHNGVINLPEVLSRIFFCGCGQARKIRLRAFGCLYVIEADVPSEKMGLMEICLDSEWESPLVI